MNIEQAILNIAAENARDAKFSLNVCIFLKLYGNAAQCFEAQIDYMDAHCKIEVKSRTKTTSAAVADAWAELTHIVGTAISKNLLQPTLEAPKVNDEVPF